MPDPLALPRDKDPRRLRSELHVRFFAGVLARQMRHHFHAVRHANRPSPYRLDEQSPLVVYCNHPSWWDAAFLPVLMRHLFPSRQVYGPIDRLALARYPFMRRIGFFGIDQEGTHAGAAEWLRVGQALLAEPSTLLVVTPQGDFTDPRDSPMRLRAGLAALLARAPHATVLPLALEYPFWSERQPEALARFGEPMHFLNGRSFRAAVQPRLEDALQQTMDSLAADAMAQEPRRFTTLLDGSTGIGGVYDLWRRARSALRGERFDAAHAPGRHGRKFEAESPR